MIDYVARTERDLGRKLTKEEKILHLKDKCFFWEESNKEEARDWILSSAIIAGNLNLGVNPLKLPIDVFDEYLMKLSKIKKDPEAYFVER